MDKYGKRIERVCAEMKKAGIGQLMVNDHLGIYYLINGDGSTVLFANRLFALGDTGLNTVTLTDTDDVAGAVAKHIKPGKMGVDKNMAARFLLPLMDVCCDTRMVLGSDCVDNVRARKDEEEKQLMRRASEINDICMEKLAAYIHDGVTEKECADYLDRCYGEFGCEGLAFDSIISFGANAADPHHSPDGTVVKEGDCIVIDIGCRKDHYCSDMTRTYFWKKADPRYAAIHDLVREANEKAEKLIRPGVRFCDIDAEARKHISAAGYGEYFTHRLGHFIGMEDHEKGDVSSVNTAAVQPDMVFSIEPGVYLPGEFGVRVEDLVIATEDGCELLNHVDKRFRVLGK